MRDLNAEIRRYKVHAFTAITAGWCLLLYAGWEIARWSGVAIAIGLPLMKWGWDSAKVLAEASDSNQ